MNKTLTYQLWLIGNSIFCTLFINLPAKTQIVPDATLPSNSNVTFDNNTSNITGGTQAGNNLFHSFEQFTVPTGGAAHFNNLPEIKNIFSRVTGSSISNIDGILKANGTANLFLLNPNGIIFGPNAKLDISGSFLGTTADSIIFTDGIKFSAATSLDTPLLTINVPIGLRFSGNSAGTIRVQGTGSQIAVNPRAIPISRTDSSTGVKVQPGKTLALVGSNVELEGGILTAEGGQIELGSVDSGLVSLKPIQDGWVLGYEGVPLFKDIQLSQKSLVDSSGVGNGSINLRGADVKLTNGSLLLNQNIGKSRSGSINVNTSKSLIIEGTSSNGNISSGLRTETLNIGNGSDIVIQARNLFLLDGGQIGALTYSEGKGGNIFITANNTIELLGVSKLNPTRNSGVAALTFGSGNAGNIQVSAEQIKAIEGGTISSSTLKLALEEI